MCFCGKIDNITIVYTLSSKVRPSVVQACNVHSYDFVFQRPFLDFQSTPMNDQHLQRGRGKCHACEPKWNHETVCQRSGDKPFGRQTLGRQYGYVRVRTRVSRGWAPTPTNPSHNPGSGLVLGLAGSELVLKLGTVAQTSVAQTVCRPNVRRATDETHEVDDDAS